MEIRRKKKKDVIYEPGGLPSMVSYHVSHTSPVSV
jgi:hypothetical protein